MVRRICACCRRSVICIGVAIAPASFYDKSVGGRGGKRNVREINTLHMLRALAGDQHLGRAYEEALAAGYLWHEFGDVHLILP